MSPFPSSQERTVASALLLLCTKSPSPSLSPPRKSDFDLNDSMPERGRSKSCTESFLSIGSKSCSSSLTNDGGSSEETRARRIRFFSAVARFRETKFKIVRKSRSKIAWTSTDPKPNTGTGSKVFSDSVSTDASSCSSSSSSGISSARSLRYFNTARGEKMLGMVVRETQNHAKHVVGSPHLRRRAEAILKLLSGGSSSELRIRQVLGDSPDTSKALRMLVRLDAVKRSGSGGRHDPYIYAIAG